MSSRGFPISSPVKTGKSLFEFLENPQASAALPSLKSVLIELAALTEKSDIRLGEVTRLVQADQGMSVRMLRMANSAYYAPTEPILHVQDAIFYVGLSSFRAAVVSARCVEKTCHIRQDILDWKEFWIHAAGVGRITMELAAQGEETELPGESFYLMGLLHDIGKVVLAQLMPEEFSLIYARAARENISPARLEMETLGIDHAHLGSWYMQKQGISPILSEPVRFHHHLVLEDKSHSRHALLIRLADHLARWFRLGESGNPVPLEDPFLSIEWKEYAGERHISEATGKELQQVVADQVIKIGDLVHRVIL